MSFIDDNQYMLAWLTYFCAAVGCCVFWWKVTSFVKNAGWRDLLRGFAVVVLFTPWYAGESSEFYAPAIVVLLMDLLLEGTKSGMKGGVALIFALFSMLLILTIRQILRNRSRR